LYNQTRDLHLYDLSKESEMSSTALTPSGVESSTNALSQWQLSQQLQQAQQSAQNTVEEGWIAVLNEATQQYSKV
jgi:hypothetical protein